MEFPSVYGTDETVQLFKVLVHSGLPRAAVGLWSDLQRIVVDSLRIPIQHLPAMLRLEHGDHLDSLNATLRRMWKIADDDSWKRFDSPSEHCVDHFDVALSILQECGNALDSFTGEKMRRFFLGVFGEEKVVDDAVSLFRAQAPDWS